MAGSGWLLTDGSFKIFLFFSSHSFNSVSEKQRGRISIWGDFCVKFITAMRSNLSFAGVSFIIEL